MLESNGLMPDRVAEIGYGLGVAVAIASFGRGVALGLFAPGEPGRRLIVCSEAEARVLADHLIWGARLLAIAVFFNVMHKGISAPISLTVATSALLALAVGLLAIHLLLRFPQGDGEAEGGSAASRWLRVLAWVFIAAVTVALITGYIGFAAFLAGRVLVVLALFGALYDRHRLRRRAVQRGADRRDRDAAVPSPRCSDISPRGLELAGTLISALFASSSSCWPSSRCSASGASSPPTCSACCRRRRSASRIGDVTISITAILTRDRDLAGRHPGDARRAALARNAASCRAPGSIPACSIRSRPCSATPC